MNGNTRVNGVSHAVPIGQLLELWHRTFHNQACGFFKRMEADDTQRFSIINGSNCSEADTQLCVEEVVSSILTGRAASVQPDVLRRTVYPIDLTKRQRAR